MDSGRDLGLMTGVVEPGLDLVDEEEGGLLRLAGAGAEAEAEAEALLSSLEPRGEPSSGLLMSQQTKKKKLDLTKEELKEILENLGPYSDTIDENCKKLLKYIIDQFPTSFKWVQKTMETKSTSIIFLNMIRYFYKQLILPILENPSNKQSRLHIVLVAKGSFNDQFYPADWLTPDSIIDTILYSPWNCRIDANVAYGIATGDLQTQHRDFRNNQVPIMQQQQVPNDWNFIRAQRQHPVPEILLGPINGAADWITRSLDDQRRLYCRSNHFIMLYRQGGDLADWLPEWPLHQIIGAIEILLMIIPPHEATIHLAADLGYRGATQPDVERLNDQYAFTPDGTVMTTQNMQFNNPEFPALYGLFQFIFGQAPPQ